MGIEYLGLSSIKGPLVILEGVQEAFLMRSSITVDGKTKKSEGSLNYTKIKQ